MTGDEPLKRAALSTLNSIAVNRGIVEWRAPRGSVRRFLDVLTGNTRRLDEAFDSHTANAMEGLQRFVRLLREDMAESDLILAKAVTTLKSVRSAVDDQSAQIHELKFELGQLETHLDRELRQLWDEVEYIGASADLNTFVLPLSADAFKEKLSYADLWSVLDRLWWGRFGRFLRSSPKSPEAVHLRAALAVMLRDILKGHGFEGLFSPAALLERVHALPTPVEMERMDLFALEPTWQLRPLTAAIRGRSVGEPDIAAEEARIPRLTTGEAIAERLLTEAERGTK